MIDNEKIIYPKLSYSITGLCFDVHNELGRYAREKQYCDLIEEKLKQNNLKYQREFVVTGSGNRVDFDIEEKIILEVKAKRAINKNDYYQIQRYLQSCKRKLGLLVNFRYEYIKPKRIIRIETDARLKFIDTN